MDIQAGRLRKIRAEKFEFFRGRKPEILGIQSMPNCFNQKPSKPRRIGSMKRAKCKAP
jgi:hypothetical protein